MNKSFGILALAALCCGAALAQSSVTIYGVVDAGLVRESGGTSGNVSNLSSGIASGSRLGFRGKEDLGNGTFVTFVLENGINIDTGAAGQGGLLFGRQARVSLNGTFGAVSLGRQYSPYYKALRDVGDPFGAVSMAGRAGNLMATNSRTDNMAEYISPNLNGLTADLAYGAGEAAGDSKKSRTLSAALAYVRGRLKAQYAYHRIENAAATDSTRNSLLVASYDFGVISANFGYALNKGTGTANSKDAVAGITVPLGAAKLLASYVHHDDRSKADKDASQLGLGCTYSLSKRTDLYSSYARIDNRNGAQFKVGNATDKGSGHRAYNLGIRHVF